MSILRGRLIIVLIMVLFVSQSAFAGPFRRFLMERRAAQTGDEDLKDSESSQGNANLPKGVRCLRDIPYGNDRNQRFDVYLSPKVINAPVILMVHGGAWRFGDKASRSVVEIKVARWVPRGFIFISINYRMLPEADPLKQADDVARALAAAQARAKSWGGDPSKFILMGHSAGAHLVALLAAEPSKARDAGAGPWLGSILLDSAALNVEQIMEGKHLRLYDRAFGKQPAYWKSVSPFDVLSTRTSPILAVCSTRREDSCPQARAFVAKAVSLGTKAAVLEENLSHREINVNLGEGNAYTISVEDFMGSLDASVKAALTNK